MATSSGRSSGASPSNLTKNLKGIDFPTDKQHLVQHAKQHHAEKIVLDEIQRLDDREYSSMADVMKGFQPATEEGKGSSRSRSSESGSSSSSGSKSSSSSSKSSHGGKSSSHR